MSCRCPRARRRTPSDAPAPTIDITIHFRTELPRPTRDGAAPDPRELVLARTHTTLTHEGFFEEDAVIWDRDGTVLVQSRQLALAIG